MSAQPQPTTPLDNSTGVWINQVSINSESSNRVYTVSQHCERRFFACSCPRYRVARHEVYCPIMRRSTGELNNKKPTLCPLCRTVLAPEERSSVPGTPTYAANGHEIRILRNCKHLRSMGLPGNETPHELTPAPAKRGFMDVYDQTYDRNRERPGNPDDWLGKLDELRGEEEPEPVQNLPRRKLTRLQ